MNTETELDVAVDDAAIGLDIGHTLQSKRQELGLDEKQVAAELKLPVKQVNALEANKFDGFRSATFARGYLKSYARMLGLDTKAILAEFDTQQGNAEKPTVKPVDRVRKQANYGDPVVMFVTAIIIAIVIFVAFWWPEYEASSQPSPSQPAVVSPAENTSDVADEAIEPDPDLNVSAESLTMPALDLAEDEIVTGLSSETRALLESDGVSPQQVEAAIAIPEPEPEPVEPPAPAFKDDIEMRFSADCWTEVRDGEGKILFSGVKSAGSALGLSGAAPFKVVLGYVPGVASFKYKGETFDYSRFVRKDLARFELN